MHKTQRKQVTIYFCGLSKASSGSGPAGAAVIFQYVKADGVTSEKLIEAGYPRLTTAQAQLMTVLAALEGLTQTGLDITLIGDSVEAEEAVLAAGAAGAQRENDELVQRLASLLMKHCVTIVRPRADNDRYLLCQKFAGQMADQQQRVFFSELATNIKLGAL